MWVVLHSGSRGIGHQLAQTHIAEAKGLMKRYFIELEDPDLAYLVQGTPEFDAYIEAMYWAVPFENEKLLMGMSRDQLRATGTVIGVAAGPTRDARSSEPHAPD